MAKVDGNDTITVKFEYDHAGIRTKKVKKVGGITTETTEYILNGDKVVELIYTDHVNNTVDILHFYYDAQGKPAMVKHGSNMYAYVYNLQGDVLGLLDNTNALVADYRYDAWGEQGPELNGDVGYLNPFRYRGYIYDRETGMYYLKSRYYNPMICRFVNADSLISDNIYGYCGNNPILQIDTNGTRYTRVSNSKELACEGRGGAGYGMPIGLMAAGGIVTLSLLGNSASISRLFVGLYDSIVDAFTLSNGIVYSESMTIMVDNDKLYTVDPIHIRKGSKNHGGHQWSKFGIDPNKPDAWSKILPIIQTVLEKKQGNTLTNLGNGKSLVEYVHYFADYDTTVMVRVFYDAIRGIEEISNVFPDSFGK